MRTYKFNIDREIISCRYCPILEGDVTDECRLMYKVDYNMSSETRPDWCPLVEVENEAAENDN